MGVMQTRVPTGVLRDLFEIYRARHDWPGGDDEAYGVNPDGSLKRERQYIASIHGRLVPIQSSLASINMMFEQLSTRGNGSIWLNLQEWPAEHNFPTVDDVIRAEDGSEWRIIQCSYSNVIANAQLVRIL